MKKYLKNGQEEEKEKMEVRMSANIVGDEYSEAAATV